MTPTFSPDPSLYPDPSGRASKVSRFIRRLTLWEGDLAGRPFHLHPFQEAILRRIYGPVDDDGARLVRTACIWIPRGNAKTTLAAGLGLAHFMGPEAEAGGQVIMAAADRENAGIAFRCSHQFVMQDDQLASRTRPVESQKRMSHPGTKSTLKAISTEAYSKHGLNVSFFLADEVHSWPAEQGRELFGVVSDSMVKRSQPLTVIISTAGSGQGGLGYDLWRYSQDVASGKIIDPSFAAIIFAADPAADWKDEAAWRDANPAIGAGFLTVKALRTKVTKAEQFPADIAAFRRFHLNQWQDGAAEPWLPLDVYDKAEPMTPVAALQGRPCWVGIDLSSTQDLTAVVAVFPGGDPEARHYDVVPMFFLPEAGLERKAEADRADYLRWAADGHLTVTPGNVVDHAAVWDYVNDLGRLYGVQEVAIDRWNAAATTTRLQGDGFTVAEFGQGFVSMAAPVKEMKRAILSGHFRHGGNPVLRMCFGNVVAEVDPAENEKFTKAPGKTRGRIDGAVAAAMAIGRIIAGEAGPSPYETMRPEGFLFVEL